MKVKIKIMGTVLVFLSSCATTEDAERALQSRWLGQPADAFFMRYGAPISSFRMANGGLIYTWRGGDKERYVGPTYISGEAQTTTIVDAAGETTTIKTPGHREMIAGPRVDSLFCELSIAVNSIGRIEYIKPSNDTDGAGLSLSRCAEVLGVAQ